MQHRPDPAVATAQVVADVQALAAQRVRAPRVTGALFHDPLAKPASPSAATTAPPSGSQTRLIAVFEQPPTPHGKEENS